MKTLLFYTLLSISGLTLPKEDEPLSGIFTTQDVLVQHTAQMELTISATQEKMVHFITISGRIGLGTTIIPVSVTVSAPSREQAENEARQAITTMKNIFEQI